ncbi:MAG: hypothetical protein JW936_01740 [Sedimentisphaerales bacterium]|nr:hypothetical protein [Sedimentisphaerales bacterium]
MERLVKVVWVLVMLVVLGGLVTGCAAGTGKYSGDEPAGFWVGIWHGVISVVTLIIHIFKDGVRVYEINNTGGWYDFGFLLGVICVWGGGSGVSCARSKRRKKEDGEWDEVCSKVEKKIKRKMRDWAEAEPDEDWDEVEKKLEGKLRDKLRRWAESED